MMRGFFKYLPWFALIAIAIWYYRNRDMFQSDEQISVSNEIILSEIENLGRLELVRYHFKEITELEKASKEYLKIFKLGPDSKIALISVGEAVGCIDLTKMESSDISASGDSVFIHLPDPELCYYKLDLNKTRIYSLQTNPLIDEKAFVKKAYQNAEDEIKQAALKSGILKQTEQNARMLLKPLLEEISGKTVVFTEKPKGIKINPL